MRIRHAAGSAIVVALALLSPMRSLPAQNVGDRVRVKTSEQTVIGEVAEADGNRLRLLLPGGWHWEVTPGAVEHLGALDLVPVLDTRPGHDGRSAVILGTRVRF